MQTPFSQIILGNTDPRVTAQRSLHGVLPRLELLLSRESLDKWEIAVSEALRNRPDTALSMQELIAAAPSIALLLSNRRFLYWSDLGVQLSLEAPAAGRAFFLSSPSVLPLIRSNQIGSWARQGRRLFHGGPQANSLAEHYFLRSASLYQAAPFNSVEQIVDTLALLKKDGIDLAEQTLQLVTQRLQSLDESTRQQSLELALRLAAHNKGAVPLFIDCGWQALSLLDSDERPGFLNILQRLENTPPAHLAGFLKSLGAVLPQLDSKSLKILLPITGRIALRSPAAAHELLTSGKELLLRLSGAELEQWCQRGEDLLRVHEGAAVSYFRLHSRQAQEAIASLSPVVTLSDVREVLRMYCQALMGKNISILAAEDIQQQANGWVPTEEASWEGPGIFAPAVMREFPSKESNFEAYKVLCTHQAGHLEFGTYEFTFGGENALFRPLRHALANGNLRAEDFLSEYDRFFALFSDRRLAQDLFTLAEDERIDTRLQQEYRGIRGPYRRVHDHTLEHRPPIMELSLREYFMEILVRRSLSAPSLVKAPRAYAPHVLAAAGILGLLNNASLSAEDATEAAIRLYTFFRQVPNVPLEAIRPERWIEIDLSEGTYDPAAEDLDDLTRAFHFSNQSAEQAQSEEGAERPYNSPAPVQHRSDLRPELMQTLMRLQQERGERSADGKQRFEGSLEDIIQKLSERAEFTDAWGTLSESEGIDPRLLLAGYLRAMTEEDPWRQGLSPIIESIAEHATQVFTYDEWDYRVKAMRPNWCQLYQRTLKEGSEDFYEETLHRNAALVHAIRKQFEMLRPEEMGRVKRLVDGEEFDLDAVVDSIVDKKAGHGLQDKVYWRRNKTQRNVAVALLLDMSLSTDEKVERHAVLRAATATDDDSRAAALRAGNFNPNKRIIDVEKESLVLFIEALEQIGDSYGIYGFSGSGRGDVQLFVVKDLKEPFSHRIKARVDKIIPLQGTRMGPAIRHAVAKLSQVEARTKLLILLSDGRPQDRDYGTLPWELESDHRGRYRPLDEVLELLGQDGIMVDERDYAVHDTKAALTEARTKSITPFCISIDKEGHDYLKAMCGDIGYEVISDVASLPRRLPSLYRSLTT